MRAGQCSAAVRATVSTGTDADRERLWSPFDQLPGALVVAGFLRGRVPAAEAARELSRSKALLLAYLQLGRMDLAVAVSEGLMVEDGQVDRWDRRLLAAARLLDAMERESSDVPDPAPEPPAGRLEPHHLPALAAGPLPGLAHRF
jgi:hypothetical protein